MWPSPTQPKIMTLRPKILTRATRFILHRLKRMTATTGAQKNQEAEESKYNILTLGRAEEVVWGLRRNRFQRMNIKDTQKVRIVAKKTHRNCHLAFSIP